MINELTKELNLSKRKNVDKLDLAKISKHTYRVAHQHNQYLEDVHLIVESEYFPCSGH